VIDDGFLTLSACSVASRVCNETFLTADVRPDGKIDTAK